MSRSYGKFTTYNQYTIFMIISLTREPGSYKLSFLRFEVFAYWFLYRADQLCTDCRIFPHEQSSGGRFLPQREVEANRVDVKKTRPTLLIQRKYWRSTPPSHPRGVQELTYCYSIVAITCPIQVGANFFFSSA